MSAASPSTMDDPVLTPDHVRPPALEAKAVSKRFGRSTQALRDVHVSVPQGTIAALVGPNGAGKSTLIRCWVGFESPDAGAVRVLGVDPATDRAGAVERLGYVSQHTGLYRGLSVADHLTLAGTLRRGFDAAEARLRLDQLGIPLGQRAGTLSGGQASQLALCIALGTHAPVLLLDEPLASLDPLARHEFLNLLVAVVRERGATALLSSHIVSDVAAACDGLVVLGGGRVTLQAPIDAALGAHRIAAPGNVDPAIAVATFARPGGELAVLVRSADATLATPSLEELVMGYLAAARSPGTGSGASGPDV
ncbi:MAG: ABC transporter ATP-binding protein [Chloroflexi bacterium]|nr:ABC transporter ATP-binding protein [Chloroflexota bacterium]